MTDLISLKDLVNRDVNFKNLGTKYQVQSQKNSNSSKIIKLDKSVPDVCIYSYEIDLFNCSLLQYSLTEKDIDAKYFPMIGYLIKTKKEEMLGTLILFFETQNNVVIDEEIKGEFNIILSNKNNEHKLIKKLDNFCGNDECVYLLTDELGKCLENILDENCTHI